MNTPIHLHPVKRATKASNQFCGPAVLSALTGLDTSETARLLRSVSGKRAIKGTTPYAMFQALTQLGISTAYCSPIDPPFPTFVRWARESHAERKTDAVLLIMGNHWAAVKGFRYACGITGKVVPFSEVPHRCARVTRAYLLARTSEVPFAKAIPPAPPKAKVDPLRATTKALAAEYGITLESVSMSAHLNPALDGVYVYPPEGLYDEDGENDPLNGERIGFSWEEVLADVQVYVTAIRAARENPLLNGNVESVTVAIS